MNGSEMNEPKQKIQQIIIGQGQCISAITGAIIEVNRAIMLQVPKTVAVYYVGKYSYVTKKHYVKALLTPAFVIKTHNVIKQTSDGSINSRKEPKTPPIANEQIKVFLEPKCYEIKPENRVINASDSPDDITLMYISPGKYFKQKPTI